MSAASDFDTDLTLSLDLIEDKTVSQLSNIEDEVENAINSAGNDSELTTGEALELQYALARWALLYEAVSNMGKKIDDAIGNTVANMR